MMSTVRSLVIDQVAGQVIEALAAEDIRSVLLKGASFACWLYDDGHPRPYGDIDLLVAPDQARAAGRVLEQLGYERRCRGALEGEQADHATNWDCPGRPTVDLHHTLSGRIGVSAQRCWEVVSSHTAPATVGGRRIEVLTLPALALHVVLHAQAGNPKTIEDLSRALRRLEVGEWRAAAQIAIALDALPALGVGLRLLPEGRAVADDLAIAEEVSVELVLQVSSTGALAQPFERLARAPGLRAKAQVVLRELMPTPDFVRLWYPRATRGWGWLATGYLYRLVWVPLHAPAGLRSWLNARRAVAAGTGARTGVD